MSVHGRIRQGLFSVARDWTHCKLLAKVIKAEAITEGSKFGRVSSGYIDIRGLLWSFFALTDKRKTVGGDVDSVVMSCGHFFSSSQYDCNLYFDLLPPQISEDDDVLHLFFLPIRISAEARRSHNGSDHSRFFFEGLLLEKVSDRKGEYRQLGTGRIPLTSLTHMEWLGHDLTVIYYLQRHGRSPVIAEAARQILHQHLDLLQSDAGRTSYKETILEVWAAAMQELKESIPKWEACGDDFWPATDLDLVRHNEFTEFEYTVRIV